MPQTDYTEMVTDIQFHIPACPTPMAVRAVRDSAISFCDRSEAYQVDLTPITLLEGVAEYDLSGQLPANTKLARIISVKFDGMRLDPTSYDLMNQEGAWEEVLGTPDRFFEDDAGILRIYPKPFGGQLAVRVAIRPDRLSTGLDDTLFEKYWDGILAGSLARLFHYSGTGWENGDIATGHAQLYASEIERAKRNKRNDNQPKRRIVRYGGY